MAKVSTLIYVLEEDRNELIDVGEIFKPESGLYGYISDVLNQIEFTAKPQLVSKILNKSGII